MISKKLLNQKIIEILKKGGVGVLPTDTLYGLVGSVFSKEAVERIYALKERNQKKPMIILIGSKNDLKLFKIKLAQKMKKWLLKLWPGKVSIILPCPFTPFRDKSLTGFKDFFYLHRGTKTLAFRLPADKKLQKLLQKTGPLVAPSANPENKKPAKTIKEAKRYFKERVDFYLDKGRLDSLPSTIVFLKGKHLILKRKGAFEIKKFLKTK